MPTSRDWWTFDFDRHLARADERVGRMVDQVDADIDAFKNRGAKAIVYQGWQDPVVNALDTIAYYEKVRVRQGSQQEIDGFFRLFLVHGMGHCSGGTGATNFGTRMRRQRSSTRSTTCSPRWTHGWRRGFHQRGLWRPESRTV